MNEPAAPKVKAAPKKKARKKAAKPRKPRATAPPGTTVNGLEHVPTAETRAKVSALATVSTHADVATIMGMSERTLDKHYALELKTAKAAANAKVAGVLYKLASSGANLGATIFWLKSQAGWREKSPVDDLPPGEKLAGLALLVAASGLRDNPQDALAYDRVIEGDSERVSK